jgi:hypothetical protein
VTGSRASFERSMRSSGRSCKGCGAELAPAKGPGRRRVWCSDRCRKGQYAGACVDCGAPTNGYDGPGKASERCRACRDRYQHEECKWTTATIVAAIRRWAVTYGVPPSAANWNPTVSRSRGDSRFELGDWPTQATVQAKFGTWNAAMAAAGYDPRPPHAPRKVAA